MNNRIHDSSDPLRTYMNPGMLEKAPERLEAGIMSRVFLEPVRKTETTAKINGIRIAAISAGVVLVLVLAAVILIPEGRVFGLLLPGFSLNIDLSVTDLISTDLRSFDLPRILISITAGIALLSVLDKILYRAFHRDHK